MISLESLFNDDTYFTNKIPDKSINSTENFNNIQSSEEKIEQNSIKLDQSLEADDESGDFEAAADESESSDNSEDNNTADGDVNSDDKDTDFGGSDDMPSFDDESGSSDAGGDGDDFGGDDKASADNDATGNNETDTGVDEIDKSAGSSLNPFTQVNQKMYLMDQMNLLYSSISNAIEKYTIMYSETVELQQLRELLNIVGNERDSFIMQENPENIIKYELYMKQYELIIRNLTNKIKEL